MFSIKCICSFILIRELYIRIHTVLVFCYLRSCCTEQICRAKVKVTAGWVPARVSGNLNQELQHKRELTISSLSVKWKMPALVSVWTEGWGNTGTFLAYKQRELTDFVGDSLTLFFFRVMSISSTTELSFVSLVFTFVHDEAFVKF